MGAQQLRDRLAERRPDLHVVERFESVGGKVNRDRIAGATTTVAGGGRRVLASTDHVARAAGGAARDRSRAVAAALRGEQPPRRWPVALVSLGVGLGVGVLVGFAVRRPPGQQANAAPEEEGLPTREGDGWVRDARSGPDAQQPAARRPSAS